MRKTLATIAVAFVTCVIHAQSPGSESAPQVASDGQQFLVVWQQATTGHPLLLSSLANSAGILLGLPMTVAAEPYAPYAHAVKFGGDAYLVVWSTSGGSLLARRVARDGTFVDMNPFTIATSGGSSVSIDWTGSKWFVVWRATNGIFGVFVASDATVSPQIAISAPTKYFSGGGPQVAWNGSGFLVTWSGVTLCDPACYTGSQGVFIVRLAAEGQRIDAPDPTYGDWYTLTDAATHQLASNGKDFMITYDRIHGGIAAARVAIGGTALQLFELPYVFSWFTTQASDLTWDGTAYVLASRYGTNVPFRPPPPRAKQWLSITRLDPDAAVLSQRAVRLPDGNSTEAPSIAVDERGTPLVAVTAIDSGAARLRTYVSDMMRVAAKPPVSPRVTSATMSGGTVYVSWTSDAPEVEGFTVDSWMFHYEVFIDPLRVTNATDRVATIDHYVPNSFYFEAVAVRAFNEGGSSLISNRVVAGPPTRRRTAPH